MERLKSRFWPVFFCVGFILLAPAIARGSSDKCSELAALQIPNAEIRLADLVPAATYGPPADADPTTIHSPIYRQMPAFCRVLLMLHPSADSTIKVELWMPASKWNQKLKAHGNGGFGGSIDYFALANSLTAGYATAATDTGHTGGDTDASWAPSHPEKVIDYGYRAIHEMTVISKQIVAAYYGHFANKSYFCSCSNGGREALMEAQRYPADFNGIIAGAPANDWTRQIIDFAWDSIALYANPASKIAVTKLPAISAAVLAACDGQEGIKDGLLNDPLGCHFNPQVLLCTGVESDSCLIQPQIDALKKIYAGARNSRGQQIFPGFEPGGELGPNGWDHWMLARPMGRQYEYAQSFFSNLVFANRHWDFKTVDFDHDVKTADAKLATVLNATDPNLDAFQKSAGKLILYHGWADAAIAPQSSIDYYKRVVAHSGSTQEFVRLYMVPGLQHCVGGPGAVSFGQLDDEMPDPHRNIYAALERWVETGYPPTDLTGTKYEKNDDPKSRVIFTRPLCAYPTRAKYNGSGDVNDARNFSCRN